MQTPLLSLLLNLMLSVENIMLHIEDLMMDGGYIATIGGRRLFCHEYISSYVYTHESITMHRHSVTFVITGVHIFTRINILGPGVHDHVAAFRTCPSSSHPRDQGRLGKDCKVLLLPCSPHTEFRQVAERLDY
jgi:hypothetical protein